MTRMYSPCGYSRTDLFNGGAIPPCPQCGSTMWSSIPTAGLPPFDPDPRVPVEWLWEPPAHTHAQPRHGYVTVGFIGGVAGLILGLVLGFRLAAGLL